MGAGMAEVKRVPADRPVFECGSALDGHRYHLWVDGDVIVVQVGCHRSRLSRAEATELAGFLQDCARTWTGG